MKEDNREDQSPKPAQIHAVVQSLADHWRELMQEVNKELAKDEENG